MNNNDNEIISEIISRLSYLEERMVILDRLLLERDPESVDRSLSDPVQKKSRISRKLKANRQIKIILLLLRNFRTRK